MTAKERDYRKYNAECDPPLTSPHLIHLDQETGAEVSSTGEGVQSYCSVARVTWGLDSEGQIVPKGTIKISVASAYQRKAPKTAGALGRPAWHWTEEGAIPALGYVPVGAWVVGSAVKRFPAGPAGKALLEAVLEAHSRVEIASCTAAFSSQVMAVIAFNPELLEKLPRAKAKAKA